MDLNEVRSKVSLLYEGGLTSEQSCLVSDVYQILEAEDKEINMSKDTPCLNDDCPDHGKAYEGNCGWRMGNYTECSDYEGSLRRPGCSCGCGLYFHDPAVVSIGRKWMCASSITKKIEEMQLEINKLKEANGVT